MSKRWFEDVHVSTCALSVWNALSTSKRDMTEDEVLALLRQKWEPELPSAFVNRGAALLVARGWLRREGDTLIGDRSPLGTLRVVQRSPDNTDLLMTTVFYAG